MGLWQHSDSGKLLVLTGEDRMLESPHCPCCAGEDDVLEVLFEDTALNSGSGYSDLTLNDTPITCYWTGTVVLNRWESASFPIATSNNVDPPETVMAKVTVVCQDCGLYSVLITESPGGLGWSSSSFGDVSNGGTPQPINTPITHDTQPPDGEPLEGGTATVSIQP